MNTFQIENAIKSNSTIYYLDVYGRKIEELNLQSDTNAYCSPMYMVNGVPRNTLTLNGKDYSVFDLYESKKQAKVELDKLMFVDDNHFNVKILFRPPLWEEFKQLKRYTVRYTFEKYSCEYDSKYLKCSISIKDKNIYVNDELIGKSIKTNYIKAINKCKTIVNDILRGAICN